MSIRTIATLAIAGVLGLIAVIILNNYLGAARKAQQQPGIAAATTPVVVASQAISRGTVLQAIVLKVVGYPQGSVPAGAFSNIADLADGKHLALQGLAPDEPVLPSEIAGPGGRTTMASSLEPGKVAVAVRSSDVAGVGGFVLPGDHVDVLLTRQVGQGNDTQSYVSQVVADNVRVLGVDQSDDIQDNKPIVSHAVTVEVTPAQAQQIALGQSVGTVSLALRRTADGQPLKKRATVVAELGFAKPPQPAPAAAQPDGVPLSGPGIVRVTRSTDTSGVRIGGR